MTTRTKLHYTFKGGPIIHIYVVPQAEPSVNPLFEEGGCYKNGYPDKSPVVMNLMRKESIDEWRKILVSRHVTLRVLK